MIQGKQKNRPTCWRRQSGDRDGKNLCVYVPAPIIAQNEAFDQSLFWQTLTNRRMVWQDGWAVRLILL